MHVPRKKKVREAFHSNSFRIFDEDLPERLKPDEVYKQRRCAARKADVSEALQTHHVPQPYNVKFIRTNVRFLNEPVAYVETESTRNEQSNWWLSPSDKTPPKQITYSKASTQRHDYQPLTHHPVSRVRGQRKKPLATGIIPTVSPLGQPRELVEHMSFMHQYDSRSITGQAGQEGRHGAFVWSERGAVGPSAFQSLEGLRSDSQGEAYIMISSQHALHSSPQMSESTETFSTQSSPDHGNHEMPRTPAETSTG